ncbi:hypothetical protein, partial [Streptomyces sp. NPDC048425]|uniref:hypothetical protein n=1 Tax=Streptomyces sp. NPDC048425 TaxID=3365548 RepID=UPI00371746A0
GSLRSGSVLTASTNPLTVAAFSDKPPTDHDHRRQASDAPQDNRKEHEGRYATPGAELSVSPAK